MEFGRLVHLAVNGVASARIAALRMVHNIRMPIGRRRGKDGSSTGHLLAYGCLDHQVHGVRHQDDEIVHAGSSAIDHAEGLAGFFQMEGPKNRIIGILPRSQYLIKAIEIPVASHEDTARILALEAEASLSPEFGDVEIAYLPLDEGSQGHRRYEVFIAKAASVAAYLAPADLAGVHVDMLLPSAVLWRWMLEDHPGVDVLVGQSSDGCLEAACVRQDGLLSIRTIDSQGVQQSSLDQALPHGLVEFLRPLLSNGQGKNSHVVGWLAEDCPQWPDGRIIFEDMSGHCEASAGDGQASPNAALVLAANCLVQSHNWQRLRHANLLPRELVLRRHQRLIQKSMHLASTCVICAMLLLYLAFRIGQARQDSQLAQLRSGIALIQKDGQAVGRKVQQLEAVRAVKLTQRDFQDVVGGLWEATPVGVTYNQAEVSAKGAIRLRGQSISLSSPFLLPESLEKRAMFKNVALHDVGQVKQGEGTMAEFSLDCLLKRGEGK